MILAEIQQYIEDRTYGEVLYPRYESYCLSKVPAVVLGLLGILQPDHTLLKIVQQTVAHRPYPLKVVVLLIDGFGWHQWLQYAERYDFFNRVTVRASHIVLRVGPNTSASEKNTAQAKLLDLRNQIISGKLDFATAARMYSR